MAFFKFRKGGDERTTPAYAPVSVEAMRKRARHRLIGAAVLVLIGVIGFPMLFDNQPRPIPVDLPINIPDKNGVKPLGTLPVGDSAPAASQIIEETAEPKASPVTPAPAVSRTASGSLSGVAPLVVAKPVLKAPEKPAAEKHVDKPADKPAEKPKAEPAKLAPTKPEPAKVDKSDSGLKAQSLLNGKESFVSAAPATNTTASAPADGARFVVQVGAFSDNTKAHEARVKLEAAGLKTYTQVVTPKEGKRIRVRVGPFETKALAEKAAAKIKKLDLPAAILEL